MEMVGEGEEREQARLLAVALDHTGDWLNTPPLKALGLHLRIRNWVGGKDAALDVTVVTPLQDNTMPGAAHTAGHALTYAYERNKWGRGGVQETGDCFLANCGRDLWGMAPRCQEGGEKAGSGSRPPHWPG